MTFQLIPSEFPYLYEENLVFFFISTYSLSHGSILFANWSGQQRGDRGEGDEGHVLHALQDCHQGEGEAQRGANQGRIRGTGPGFDPSIRRHSGI
jgi:hypothetical protein